MGRLLIATVGIAGGTAALAAVPVEREVRSEHTIEVLGARAGRPIGAIDFSASGGASRRLGPWDVETDSFQDAGGTIFYNDGSTRGRASGRVSDQASDREPDQEPQYDRGLEDGCTTLGNVTVCR